MRLGRVLAVVAASASLVLLAWVVLAQQPRFVPKPPVRNFAPPASSPYAFYVETFSSQNDYSPLSPPSLPGVDRSLLPVKVELRKGLVLDGQIAVTGPLACATAFGEAAIPLAAIRGIRLHEEQAVASGERVGPQATIILSNNDSLTVSLRATQFQVKTEWGEANIGVSHLRSILLTADDVEWQEVSGRWALVAKVKPAPADDGIDTTLPPASGETTNPRRLELPSDPTGVRTEAPSSVPDLPGFPKPSEG